MTRHVWLGWRVMGVTLLRCSHCNGRVVMVSFGPLGHGIQSASSLTMVHARPWRRCLPFHMGRSPP